MVSRRAYSGPSLSQGASPSTSKVSATATSAPPGHGGNCAGGFCMIDPIVRWSSAMMSLPLGHGAAAADDAGLVAATGADYADECAICNAATWNSRGYVPAGDDSC